MIIITASIGSPKNFFSAFQILRTRTGRAITCFSSLIWKVLAEIPWAPDALFFQPLDDFLHLVKNQRDSADSFV